MLCQRTSWTAGNCTADLSKCFNFSVLDCYLLPHGLICFCAILYHIDGNCRVFVETMEHGCRPLIVMLTGKN